MRTLRLSAHVLLSALVASAVLPGLAAEDENAILTRMSGNYRDNMVVYRTQTTGGSDSYTAGTMSIRMPKGKGGIVGTLAVPGIITYRFTGQVTKARVVGRTVRYSGNLRLVVPGAFLTQRNFRATASPKGTKGEVLATVFKVNATVGGESVTLSTVFRGTK